MSDGDHQSMKNSKQKDSSKPGNDRISKLPHHILDLILSSLPTTEDTVRTSFLAKQWRYLWTSVPSIDISCYRGAKPFNKKEFEEFVDWVIRKNPQHLDSFRLNCSNHFSMATVDIWIRLVVYRKVKRLELIFRPKDEKCELPHCLVTLDSLKVLRLFLLRSPLRLPVFEQIPVFPALRVLELNGVELFDYESVVNEFFRSCRLLEELVLVDCLIAKLDYLSISCPNLKTLRTDNRKLLEYKYSNDGICRTLEIHCPKLVSWDYGGHIALEFLLETQSLKKAVIYPEDMIQERNLGETICNLFEGVSNVESLSINHYFILCVTVYGQYPESLPNLKTLELMAMANAVTLNILINILKRCPILESLHLIIEEGISPQYFQELVGELNKVETREILTRHLKRVEFLEFNREKMILGVARFLLEHGNALEEMVFSWRNEDTYNERSKETINEVSQFNKASSSVKLITLLKDP